MYIYLGSSILFYCSYLTLEKYAPDYFPDSSKTAPLVTRKYRIANFVKALALTGLSLPGTQFLYDVTFSPEELNINVLNAIGATYVATDFSSMFYNRLMHQSTLVHHIVVQLFYYYCYYNNFDLDNEIVRGIGIYCVLSSYASIVNLRLALRCCSDKTKYIENFVNEVAIFIYITVSVINWIVQFSLLVSAMNICYISQLIYAGALTMTINDDLFLIKYLRNYTPSLEAASPE